MLLIQKAQDSVRPRTALRTGGCETKQHVSSEHAARLCAAFVEGLRVGGNFFYNAWGELCQGLTARLGFLRYLKLGEGLLFGQASIDNQTLYILFFR